ncbi:MAG: hypothetical protein P4L64_10450 [Caulobacteraceae bacterium]|nr:hypothetical protein [Caulobacteraceae bacterium]
MLSITTAQLAALQAHAMAVFEPTSLDHLRTELADLTEEASDVALLARIRDAAPRALGYGLESFEDVQAFIDTGFLLDDPDFDRNPDHAWAKTILSDPDLTPATKASRLLDIAFDLNQAL